MVPELGLCRLVDDKPLQTALVTIIDYIDRLIEEYRMEGHWPSTVVQSVDATPCQRQGCTAADRLLACRLWNGTGSTGIHLLPTCQVMLLSNGNAAYANPAAQQCMQPCSHMPAATNSSSRHHQCAGSLSSVTQQYISPCTPNMFAQPCT
jgi:hypothetical protein